MHCARRMRADLRGHGERREDGSARFGQGVGLHSRRRRLGGVEARSTRTIGRHLVETVQRIEAVGAGFRNLTEGIDTTTTPGRLLLHLFAILAQFERDLIKDRINAVKAAKARGRSGGPPRSTDDSQSTNAERMIAAGELTLPEAARRLAVSESTLRTWRRDKRQRSGSETKSAPVSAD